VDQKDQSSLERLRAERKAKIDELKEKNKLLPDTAAYSGKQVSVPLHMISDADVLCALPLQYN
jgi:hypothetical protein